RGWFSGRTRHHLQWPVRPQGDTAGGGREAEPGDPRDATKEGSRRPTRRAWLGSARQHTAAVRRVSRRRVAQMGRAGEAGQYQGTRMSPPAAPADTRPFSPKIARNYPRPELRLPPGACDCHFHFIGPQKQFTLKPNHVFSHLQFEDTPIEDWLKMQAALGLSRGLHVLSMMYEHNYEIALHAQNRLGDRIPP